MATITLNIPADQVARIQAAAAAAGYPDGRTYAIALVTRAVLDFEREKRRSDAEQAMTAAESYNQTITLT